MNQTAIVCLLSFVVVVGGLGVILFLTRPVCPECGSRKIGERSREPLSMRDVSYHSGGGGGGYSSTQIIFDVRFRCKQCQKEWSSTVTDGEGGGYTSTQIIYNVKFRCGDCQAQWTQIVTETR